MVLLKITIWNILVKLRLVIPSSPVCLAIFRWYLWVPSPGVCCSCPTWICCNHTTSGFFVYAWNTDLHIFSPQEPTLGTGLSSVSISEWLISLVLQRWLSRSPPSLLNPVLRSRSQLQILKHACFYLDCS